MNQPLSPPTEFNQVREQLLLRDAARLGRQLAGAARNPRFDYERFGRELQQARLAADNRAALLPQAIA